MRVPTIRYKDGREYRCFRSASSGEWIVDRSSESTVGSSNPHSLAPLENRDRREPSLIELLSKPAGYRLIRGFNILEGKSQV